MPELPEVTVMVNSLDHKTKNKIIKDVIVSEEVKKSKSIGKEAIIKGQTVEEFANLVTGKQIIDLKRRGKYLIFVLQDENEKVYIPGHLGMSGAYFVVKKIEDIPDKNYRKHHHIQFKLNTGEILVYSDIRRFGEMRALTEEQFQDFKPFKIMAPEPFDANAKGYFLSHAQLRKNQDKEIKDFMMDSNKFLNGAGNIYATESLHMAKLRPQRLIKHIPIKDLENLFDCVVYHLKLGIELRGASISDYLDSDGNRGSYQTVIKVYGKKECVDCGTKIEKVKVKGRTSSYCPKCQH